MRIGIGNEIERGDNGIAGIDPDRFETDCQKDRPEEFEQKGGGGRPSDVRGGRSFSLNPAFRKAEGIPVQANG